jgi:enediyne biosynthesis protein E4
MPAALAALTLIGAAGAPQSPTRDAPPASADAAAGVRFVDRTADAGLAGFTHRSGTPEKRYVVETTGSGVAVFDFDRDGRQDLYIVNGSTLDHLRRGLPAPRAALYRNIGGGAFRDATEATGTANQRWGQGVCSGDVDNDGFADLYVTNVGVNRLYVRRGERFEDRAVAAGVAVGGWSTGCAFGDYDGDGWLDLYVAGYVAFDLEHLPPAPPDTAAPAAASPATTPATLPRDRVGLGASLAPGAAFCTYRGEPVMCGPLGLPGAADHLFRNNRDGTFTEVTDSAGVTDRERRFGFGVAWLDMDDDGRLDLLVANDSGPNHVYRNLGNGRFEDVAYASGAALDANGRTQAHMGVAVGDYDNDGRNDVHITNFADDYNVLYRNHDGRSFTDVSYPAGVAQPSVPFLGWGTDFLDYDNDGWLDLVVVNGHVYPAADRLPWNTSYAQRALLFRNLSGTRFVEVGAAAGPALTTPRVARGSAIGDLDDDGDVDLVVNTIDGPPLLAMNDGGHAAGHWLSLQLVGDPAQRGPADAIGSVVFVTAGGVRRRRDVASGRGQISQSDLRVHIGLGRETMVTAVDVRWANGPTVRYQVPRVDAAYTIDQKTGTVTPR